MNETGPYAKAAYEAKCMWGSIMALDILAFLLVRPMKNSSPLSFLLAPMRIPLVKRTIFVLFDMWTIQSLLWTMGHPLLRRDSHALHMKVIFYGCMAIGVYKMVVNIVHIFHGLCGSAPKNAAKAE